MMSLHKFYSVFGNQPIEHNSIYGYDFEFSLMCDIKCLAIRLTALIACLVQCQIRDLFFPEPQCRIYIVYSFACNLVMYVFI